MLVEDLMVTGRLLIILISYRVAIRFNVLKNLGSNQLSIASGLAMYIHVAVHFRSDFSGSEIHDLRRLRREGSPERLSRS